MEFVWDERKSRLNRQKRGVSFETAISVFDDPFHVSVQEREVEGEVRWQTIGMVKGLPLLLVAHTVEEEEERVRVISAARQRVVNGAAMRKAAKQGKRKAAGQKPAERQRRELRALRALPDGQIDTSDIAELPPSAWKDVIRGSFYRPMEQAVSMRLDADVVAWLKKRGKGYQTRANRILRERMMNETRG